MKRFRILLRSDRRDVFGSGDLVREFALFCFIYNAFSGRFLQRKVLLEREREREVLFEKFPDLETHSNGFTLKPNRALIRFEEPSRSRVGTKKE